MTDRRYNEIKEALEILELPETATLDRIKKNYKKLIKKWHPDKCTDNPEKCKEMTQQINQAFDIIMNYCKGYEYSFRKEDIERQPLKNYEDWWHARFGDDPIMGEMKEEQHVPDFVERRRL